jgi:HlyD family secretion protein
MSRWLWILLGLVVVAIGTSFALKPKGVPVDVAIASRQSIREYVEEQAKTRLPETYQITMPLQGRVLPIELDEGDRVEADQIVAQMDTGDLETELVEWKNTVRRYAKNLEQIAIAVEQAEQTVKASQAKYDFAERVFSRTQTLAQQNTTSREQLERAELAMTEAALDLRKEQLNKNIYTIMQGVVELMQETDVAKREKAQRDLTRATIRSPVSGVVLTKDVSNEKVLAAGTVLLEIGNPAELEIEVDVLTQDVVKIQPGDAVDIEGAAIGPEAVPGVVAKIYPQGFTKVSSLGVEQQRVTVIVDFGEGVLQELADAGRQLGVDYRVRVKIYTDVTENALVIPRAALFRSAAGAWQVFVVRDNKAMLTDVKVGLRNDFAVEILEGIVDDEPVIVAPDSTLETGTLVEPSVL